MPDFKTLLKSLNDHEVRFVVVGGMAGITHGASTPTFDLDVCYERTLTNVERLLAALEPFNPRARGTGDDVDERWLMSGMSACTTTTVGSLDLLANIKGVGPYAALAAEAISVDLWGVQVLVMGLEDLIVAKRTMGRPKDLMMLQELAKISDHF